MPQNELPVALDESLRRKEWKEIFDSWNEAYADGLDEDERAGIEFAEALHWEILEDEEW